MDCREICERLSEYLDEVLGGRDMERVARHLAACPACRAEADELRAAVAALHNEPVPPVSPAFWTKIYEQVETEGARIPAPRAARPSWLAWTRSSPRLPGIMTAGSLAIALALALTRPPMPRPLMPQSAFAPAPGDLAEFVSYHQARSLARDPVGGFLGVPVAFPQQVPALGYALRGTTCREDQGERVVHVLYEGGPATLSLFVDRHVAEIGIPRGEPVSLAGRPAFLRVDPHLVALRWSNGGLRHTLVGAAPPEVLLQVGAELAR